MVWRVRLLIDCWALEFEFKFTGRREPSEVFELGVASAEPQFQKINKHQCI